MHQTRLNDAALHETHAVPDHVGGSMLNDDPVSGVEVVGIDWYMQQLEPPNVQALAR